MTEKIVSFVTFANMADQQGPVYDRIIVDVINESKVDFEESGVDPGTLEKLKEVWQKNVSSLNIGQFPWDPTPMKMQQNAQSLHLNAQKPAPKPSMPPMRQDPQIKVKTDPPSLNSIPAAPSGIMNGQVNNVAQMRAAQNLSQQFGHQANQQVRALQGSTPGMMFPGQPAQGQPQNPNGRNSLQASQLDGADDLSDEEALLQWKRIVAKRRLAAQPGRINPEDGEEEPTTAEVDDLMQKGIELMSINKSSSLPSEIKQMYPRHAKGRNGPTATISLLPSGSIKVPARRSKSTIAGISRVDGSDDSSPVKSETQDDELINSDLDDSDEHLESDDDDETRQIMLCTYERVQRVKNKWKCTMTNGILAVNDKEFVFHKAQGEYEW